MKRVLIVDDEAMNRDVIAKILSKERFFILEAANGKEALEILKKDNIDLVLIDIMMPVMDGFETIEVIRMQSCYDKVPLIAVTALNDNQTIQKVLELGVSSYISKPFVLSELVKSVKTVLKIPV